MIEINNLTGANIKEDFLKKIAIIVLGKNKFDLSIVLVGQARIKELNMEYRRVNKPTDVLSFFYGDSGEIVLCPFVIRRNAKEYKVVFQNEFSRILIHGILHLLGFDHEKSKEKAKKMREKEEYYLSKIYGKR